MIINKHVKRSERGFTLIEIMVVVAIIGILAAIGMPTLTAYMRTAETAEAVESMERINKGLKGLASSRMGGAADAVALVNNNTTLFPGNTNISTLDDVIPHIALNADAKFRYAVTTGVLGSEIGFCIMATGITANGASNDGTIYMSSSLISNAASAQWENYINRANFVTGAAMTAGGHCSAAGAYQ